MSEPATLFLPSESSNNLANEIRAGMGARIAAKIVEEFAQRPVALGEMTRSEVNRLHDHFVFRNDAALEVLDEIEEVLDLLSRPHVGTSGDHHIGPSLTRSYHGER